MKKTVFMFILLLVVLLALPALAAQQKTAAGSPSGKTDIAIWRPGDGWYLINSSDGSKQKLDRWGESGDISVSGDYDGDGKTDLAVWRPSTGIWYIIKSSDNAKTASETWGLPTDMPVVGDYDGDGKTDLAVWRPSTGVWYIIKSSTGSKTASETWGVPGDIPVPGDYDGDGKTDLAVWRPSTGMWYVIYSSTGQKASLGPWGLSTDTPVVGDYDGDGKTDLAVWRPSTGVWYIVRSSDGAKTASETWGVSTDTPVPGDYDGDGKTDLAIWRPGDGWYIINSSAGVKVKNERWGESGDVPVPGNYDGDGDNSGPIFLAIFDNITRTESGNLTNPDVYPVKLTGTCVDTDGDPVAYDITSDNESVVKGSVDDNSTAKLEMTGIGTAKVTYGCSSKGPSGVRRITVQQITYTSTSLPLTLGKIESVTVAATDQVAYIPLIGIKYTLLTDPQLKDSVNLVMSTNHGCTSGMLDKTSWTVDRLNERIAIYYTVINASTYDDFVSTGTGFISGTSNFGVMGNLF